MIGFGAILFAVLRRSVPHYCMLTVAVVDEAIDSTVADLVDKYCINPLIGKITIVKVGIDGDTIKTICLIESV